MYQVIDNLLSESDFKKLKDLFVRYETVTNQEWPQYLTDSNNVTLIKPVITEIEPNRFKPEEVIIFEKFRNAISNHLIEYSDLKVISWKQSIYRFKYGSGILLHRDSDGFNAKSPHDGKRLGISFYFNEDWNPNWGGELCIYQGGDEEWGDTTNKKNDFYKSLLLDDVINPRPNRLVIVDGPWHKLNPNQSKSNDRLSLQTFITLRPKHSTKPKISKRKNK